MLPARVHCFDVRAARGPVSFGQRIVFASYSSCVSSAFFVRVQSLCTVLTCITVDSDLEERDDARHRAEPAVRDEHTPEELHHAQGAA